MAINGWDNPALATGLKRQERREQQQAAEARDRRAQLKRTLDEELPCGRCSGPSSSRR
jgi:hypothetical protein